MAAEWFCKIGEKKYGPWNDKQLKTVVAKGQLKPEHLVRQGSEGPWVPAGRVKGLFPSGTAGNAQSPGKKLPKAGAQASPRGPAKPGTSPAKAGGLPTATEAPSPPPADMPQELTLGGHKHHVQMNVDSLNIQAAPIDMSRRKVRTGLKGLKKEDQKKMTIILWCFGGGGILFGVLAFTWALIWGPLSGTKKEESSQAESGQSADSGKPANSGKPADSGKQPEKKETAEAKGPSELTGKVEVPLVVGDVEVTVLKPMLVPKPDGAKTNETEVLIVPVRLNLKEGATKKEVPLTSWADEEFQKKFTEDQKKHWLTDDQKKTYELLDQVTGKEKDKKLITTEWGKASVTKKWLTAYLVFEPLTEKKVKSLRLTLPAAAFQADGPLMKFEIRASDIVPNAAKPSEEKAASGDDASKSEEAKAKKPKEEKPKADGDGDSK